MKGRFLIIVILGIMLLLSSATTKVLIIGVGSFHDPRIVPLPGAITDALAFEKAILELGIAKRENVRLVQNPSLAIMNSEIQKLFNNIKPQDRIVFYYTGDRTFNSRSE